MHFLIDYNHRSKIHKSRRSVLHGLVTREARFWWSFASRLSAEYLFSVICLALNPSTAGSTCESLLISRSFSPIDWKCCFPTQQTSRGHCVINSGCDLVGRPEAHGPNGEILALLSHRVHSRVAMSLHQSYAPRQGTGWSSTAS